MVIEFWKTGENPITCYNSRKSIEVLAVRVPGKIKERGIKTKVPVTIVSAAGVKEEFESVVKAANKVGMNPSTIAAFLNGRARNPTEYKIYKSTLNN